MDAKVEIPGNRISGVKLRATRARVDFADHPEFPGLSYKKLRDDLEQLFSAREQFTHTVAIEAADLIKTFYLNYHDDAERGRRDPFAIHPDEFARLCGRLIDDLKNPKSPLWETVNWAHVGGRGESIPQDRVDAIAQQIISKLQHDIAYRLKPEFAVDADALRRLDFRPDELRPQMLQAIKHWSADESLHPVHAILDAARTLDPDLPTFAQHRHILNKYGMSKLEDDLVKVLKDDRRKHPPRWYDDEPRDVNLKRHAEGSSSRGMNLDASVTEAATNAIIVFLFYSQGNKPVDIDPPAFVNKALELMYDSAQVSNVAYAGNLRRLHLNRRQRAQLDNDPNAAILFRPEELAESYSSDNKYNVYRVFASAFHQAYGYPVSHETMIELKDTLTKRVLHEIDGARFKPDERPSDAASREYLDAARRWFDQGMAAIADPRTHLLVRMNGRFDGNDPRIDDLAALTVDHYRVSAPSQQLRPQRIRQDGRSFYTGSARTWERDEKSLHHTAKTLLNDSAWHPFLLAYTTANGGRLVPERTFEAYRNAVASQLASAIAYRLGELPRMPAQSWETEPLTPARKELLGKLAEIGEVSMPHPSCPYDMERASEIADETVSRKHLARKTREITKRNVSLPVKLAPEGHAARARAMSRPGGTIHGGY